MPRLAPRLLHHARRLSPLLPTLLAEARTLDSARSELRWLREAAQSPEHLRHLCNLRGRFHYPLQYLLGTQPFGPLNIRCRTGVLIPRPETEQYTLHLATLLCEHCRHARVLDLCTGTGCIALTLAIMGSTSEVMGVDISMRAYRLANENIVLNSVQGVEFELADIMDFKPPKVDVVVSNPPYVSQEGWDKKTGISVRKWEPKSAVVAEENGDRFYGVIGRIAEEAGAKAVVAEVGGAEQAERVRKMWSGWEGTGIWRDFRGKHRVVVAWRKGGEWIQTQPNGETTA